MTDHNFEPRHTEMGRHVASGILNSGMVQIVKVMGQFASVIVLSRLLAPADFGLVAMVGPVFGFVSLFQGLGLNQASVQKTKLSHDEANAFFWINVGVGLVLSLVVMGLSPLVGWFYGDPRVVHLTMAMGLLVIVGAVGNQHGTILYRRMEFRTSALIDIFSTVSSLAISILCAWTMRSYWALYIGLASSIVIPVITIWIVVKWRPTAPRLVPGLRDMLKFGMHITSANVAYFISGNIDNVLIGRYWGEHELGLYDRAYKLLLFPMQRVVYPLGGIMVPVLSRLKDDPARYRRAFFKTVAQLTFAAWPGILCAIMMANTLIPFVLGKNWAGTAPLFQPLATASLFSIINAPLAWLLISQGRGGEYARWSYFSVAMSITAIVIGLHYGALGVATALLISSCIGTPIFWPYVTRKGPVKLTDILHGFLPQMTGVTASFLVLFAYRGLVNAPPFVFLAGGAILSYSICALVMAAFPGGRETLKQSIKAVRHMLQHITSKDDPRV